MSTGPSHGCNPPFHRSGSSSCIFPASEHSQRSSVPLTGVLMERRCRAARSSDFSGSFGNSSWVPRTVPVSCSAATASLCRCYHPVRVLVSSVLGDGPRTPKRRIWFGDCLRDSGDSTAARPSTLELLHFPAHVGEFISSVHPSFHGRPFAKERMMIGVTFAHDNKPPRMLRAICQWTHKILTPDRGLIHIHLETIRVRQATSEAERRSHLPHGIHVGVIPFCSTAAGFGGMPPKSECSGGPSNWEQPARSSKDSGYIDQSGTTR
ncbi:hypothetical protein EV401DRAFT_2197681 [Pisolithus croceorrhizus]|nr:hypothetical protein EV401DRAFT_2197681 [Pisolithus croceorrhizus]